MFSQMGLRPASETDTDATTSDDISSSSASEISDSSLDEVVDPKTGTKQFVPKQLDEDGMSLGVHLSNQGGILKNSTFTVLKVFVGLRFFTRRFPQTTSGVKCEIDEMCCAKFAAKNWRALSCAKNCARQRWTPSKIRKWNRSAHVCVSYFANSCERRRSDSGLRGGYFL